MNFFGHALVATWRDRDPRLVLGAMLPDFASMCGVRLEGADDPIVARGIALHHSTDEVFHGSQSFLRIYSSGTRALLDRGVARGASRAVAHVGSELLIDGLLLDTSDIATVYLQATDLAKDTPLRWNDGGKRFQAFCDRLSGHGLPVEYRDPDRVATRLEQALSRRPRLAIAPSERDAVRAWLAQSRIDLDRGLPELLREVQEGLSRHIDTPP